ncbi:transposase [Sphingomonas trueperi]
MLHGLPAGCIVHAGRAYDTNRIRDIIERQGAVPHIPPKANRRCKSCFSRSLYKGRNAIERISCRLKDCRRRATRYDRTAAIFPPCRQHHVVFAGRSPRKMLVTTEFGAPAPAIARRHKRALQTFAFTV